MIRLPEAIRADGGAYEFKGWSLNGDEGTLYQAGDEVVVDRELAKDADTLMFTAEWEKKVNVKYAVAIYGINQDVEQSGKHIPLTFGPATGKNYVDSYNACANTSAEQPMNGNGHKCLHWMSWSEIIEQANKDPNVFMDCLKNGCTHSVELSFGDSPLKSSTYPNMSGDGASILYDSLNSNYRKWNAEDDNIGGWPASRIRTTLNGKEKCADDTNASVAGSSLLSESQALISAFPEELRNAIVPKAVKSDTVYDSEEPGNVKTTYDKLWLFSGAEVYIPGASNNNVIRNNESLSGDTKYYQRIAEMNITTKEYAGNKGYNERGSATYRWLRSVYRGSSGDAFHVTSSGDWVYLYTSNTGGGLAPGFCLGE